MPSRLALTILGKESVETLSAVDVGAASDVPILVKHAKKRPQVQPRWSSPSVLRQSGQLDATLRDSPLIDRGTTSRVFVSYSWDEIKSADVPGGLSHDKKSGVSEEVHVGEDFAEDSGNEVAERELIDFRLPFIDTQARTIKVQLVAEGGFAGCFGETPRSERQLKGEDHEVVIPNSAVPPLPAVEYALPLTAFNRTKADNMSRSFRKGNALRIYLGSSWFATGRGEMLGVVCAPESQESLDDPARRRNEKYFSQWGAEVLLKTSSLSDGPFAHQFPKAEVLFDGVNSITPEELQLGPPLKRPAIVAAHTVRYDQIKRSWYADIFVDEANRSYLPWLRLGLVRFQRDSISECHVSPVVLSSFCQLLPDRTLTIVRNVLDPCRVSLTVAGIGPLALTQEDDHLSVALEVIVLREFDPRDRYLGELYPDNTGKCG
jgi:hypothetical protein